MELVHLGHTDDEIKKKQKENDQKIKDLKKDATLTKEQKKEQEKALKAENHTLGLEKDGNRIATAELNRLDSIGERNGLQLIDFTLSTDSAHDFASEPRIVDDPGAGKQAFTLVGYSTRIYLNTKSEGYKLSVSGEADWITYGATALRHEQSHRDGKTPEARSEHLAYTTQLRILQKFGPTAFKSRGFYDTAVDFAIKAGKRKD